MSLTLFLLIGTALTGAAFLWARRRGVAAGTPHTCRCPGCGQKVRYPASRAGRATTCPRCGRPWTLPTSPRQPSPPRHAKAESAEGANRPRWRPARRMAADLPPRRS